ncbi:MAG: hypothetical protein ACRDT6_16400 [Micromonosporaceae bacterium]
MYRVIMEQTGAPFPTQVTRLKDVQSRDAAIQMFHQWRNEDPRAVASGRVKVKVIEV